MTKAIVIASGGMDSTVLAYQYDAHGDEPTLLSFDYGQRHKKELDYAARTAERLGVDHLTIDLSGLGRVLTSALTSDDIAVPHGHYAAESMRATVVPNRNLIMLAVAGGVAASRGAGIVATGVHAGDHAIYPDCREGFINAAELAIKLGTEGVGPVPVVLEAPFVRITKADICARGEALNVPWEDTWSCYEGLTHHCGLCGTCVERIEAFQLANVTDPTTYAAVPATT